MSDKESSDNYKWINCYIGDRHRIITATYPMDMDGKTQYGSMHILQYRRGNNKWEGLKYFSRWEWARKRVKQMFNHELLPSKGYVPKAVGSLPAVK